MLKSFVILLAVVGLGACASRGSISTDDPGPYEIEDPLKNRLPDSLPMHIFPTEAGKKGTFKKHEKKKLRIIDVPLGRQVPDQRLRMFLFPNKGFQVPSVPAPLPAPDSALSKRDCRLGARDKKRSQARGDESLSKAVVYFEHASSILDEIGREHLRQWMNALPESYPITITGYTDDRSVIPGGRAENERLAQDRAEMTRNYLSFLGLDETRMTVKASPLCCYLASNATEAGRAKNRRAEVVATEALLEAPPGTPAC